MKKLVFIILFAFISSFCFSNAVNAQCSICTKTAGQLGEKPARSLNSGIVYLMLTPFAIVGYIGFKWWKAEKQSEA